MADPGRLRVANGHGYWGDLPQAVRWQVESGPIDVLTLVYLEETTMGILARLMQDSPDFGFVPDVVDHLEPVLKQCYEEDIPIVTSAGGLNPEQCGYDISAVQRMLGMEGHIGVVLGDDCRNRLSGWQSAEWLPDEDRAFLREYESSILTANRYFGSRGIARALDKEAQVVVTGRVTDSALVLGPAMSHFGWASDDYERLAAGVVAGHILESGGQATGGNFAGDWESVPDLWNLGYPIAEITGDGEVFITKHPNLGGRVSVETVSEQLLFELDEPSSYKTPDVTVDFSEVEILPAGENRVRITGFAGGPPPETDRISVLYQDGYQLEGQLIYRGAKAEKKCRVAEDIIRRRLQELTSMPDELRFSTPGFGRDDPAGSGVVDPTEEVVLRLAAVDQQEEVLDMVSQQLTGLIQSGPPGCTGIDSVRLRPRPRPIIRQRSFQAPRRQDDFRLSWP